MRGSCMESICTIGILKVCAAESFGAAALEGKWDEITRNQNACQAWFPSLYAVSSRVVASCQTKKNNCNWHAREARAVHAHMREISRANI